MDLETMRTASRSRINRILNTFKHNIAIFVMLFWIGNTRPFMRKPSDESLLWIQMVAGDEKSLGELMLVYFKPLLNYGYKFVKNDEFIKDCIQDMFIDIWNSKEKITLPLSIKAYLFVCLKRKIQRNIISEPYLEAIEDQVQLFVTFSPESDLIKEESIAIRARRIAEALNALPKRQREVVYLKFFEEMSREEISALLSISPQTVSNLLQIAFSHIRKEWKFAPISLLLFYLNPYLSF